MDGMNDFARIAAVIRHLDDSHEAQPSLSELASVAGLGESHFHRLFRRWAGVTPKDFLQCLTLEHAKHRLSGAAGVLDAALDAGLSGPGRLHDLFVTLEAASPGEYKNGGRGMGITWGVAPSPFGTCSLGWSSRGICHLAFHDEGAISDVPTALGKAWPLADFRRSDREAGTRARAVFQHDAGAALPLKVLVRGSAFQLKVWKALLRIPEGSVSTYGRMAEALGSSGAARAVGTACGANPVAWLIPCHRVIRETGVVKGYRWGTDRKKAMLARESVRLSA